jgi:hypothetical protein
MTQIFVALHNHPPLVKLGETAISMTIKAVLHQFKIVDNTVWQNHSGQPVIFIAIQTLDQYLRQRLEQLLELGFEWEVTSWQGQAVVQLTYIAERKEPSIN